MTQLFVGEVGGVNCLGGAVKVPAVYTGEGDNQKREIIKIVVLK